MSFTASQGQDKSRHFPVLLCVSFSSPSPLQQMVKRKSLSAGGRMHQGQGLSFEVHSEPGWFDRTILHTLSLIKYMRKKKAGFAKQLDTKILIRLGILQNSRLEPHSPTDTYRNMQKQIDIHRTTFNQHWVEKGGKRWRKWQNWYSRGLQRLLLYDERQSA